jgi:selenocysteine lyase/cysteine desulfurase
MRRRRVRRSVTATIIVWLRGRHLRSTYRLAKHAAIEGACCVSESREGQPAASTSTASRFDNSISWLAAIGDEAALSVFDTFGAHEIFRRNSELADLLRSAMADIGRQPIDLPVANRSSIVSVRLGDADAAHLLAQLKQRSIVCSARDGNLRLAVHFYNHEDDIQQITTALTEL